MSRTNHLHRSPNFRWAANLVFLAAVILLLVTVFGAVISLATEMFIILFFGLLFGVFLVGASSALAEWTPLRYGWALGVVTTLFIVVIALGVVLFGVKIEQQMAAASDHIEQGAADLREIIEERPSLENIVASTPLLGRLVSDDSSKSEEKDDEQDRDSTSDDESSDQSSQGESDASAEEDESGAGGEGLVSLATRGDALESTVEQGIDVLLEVFRTTFGLVVNSVLIFFIGLYLATNPASYREGVVSLFPERSRERTREIMNDIGSTLWSFILGRLATMTITGVGAATLLWALGVPMAITLGVVTALLTFIPNIGSAIALLLAMLAAIPQGGNTVLWVVVGYTLLQLVESYIISPLIQKRQASLPPALLLATQAVMSVLFGLLGAAVAGPMLVVVKVGVEDAYINGILEDNASDR